MHSISEFSKNQIRPKDRGIRTPELLWNLAKGSANEKQSRVLVNFQERRIEAD